MIHPSYTELMNVINKDVEPGEQPAIQSRYSLVIATSKRLTEHSHMLKAQARSLYQLLSKNYIRKKLRLSAMLLIMKQNNVNS